MADPVDPVDRRALRVLDAGASTTVQDPGRPGWAHLGVPRSGWLDPVSATLANRLVGNAEGEALLECVLGGLALQAGQAVTVAVCGARCEVTVGGRPAAFGAALSVPAGAGLRLGRVDEGLRVYVAVAGGVAVEPVLGSRSTDTLSGLGPPPLAPGHVLPVGTASGPPPAAEAVQSAMEQLRRSRDGEVVLRCLPGPRVDWFVPGVAERLAASTYVVQPDSDRIAVRLDGAPIHRRPAAVDRELASEGLVVGAVQVPQDGQPLVFLADHPTTGGYPVLAVVDPDDVPQCAHLRPGDRVRLDPRRSPVW